MKTRISALLFSLLALVAHAQTPNEVWEKPTTGYNSHSQVFSINRVAMGDDRTEVTFHVSYRPNHWIRMASTSYLQVGDKRFAMRKEMPLWPAEGTTLLMPDEQFFMPDSGEVDFTMVFDPLPRGTTHFDLIEPAGWQIFNIRPGNVLPQGLMDTYWRNEATGDWFIGFTEQYVIYNNCMWEILSRTEKKTTTTFVARNRKDELTVSVSKMKKGVRKIRIGEEKAVVCSPILTATLPDYPTRDLRPDFKDNGYQAGDSATIVGWIKDFPALAKPAQADGSFEVFIENFVSDEQEVFNTPTDSLGRFCIKVPLLNTSQVHMAGHNREFICHTVLEPGETYFYLYDCKTGQQFFMGRDVRFQNELLTHEDASAFPIFHKEHATAEEAMAYLEEGKAWLGEENARLDSLLSAHPDLSQRYINFMRDSRRVQLGLELMQARFYVKKFQLPKAYVDYVSQELWLQQRRPYTLHRDFSTLMRDYIDVRTESNQEKKMDVLSMIETMARRGELPLSDKEIDALSRIEEEKEKLDRAIDATNDETEINALIQDFNSSEFIATINGVVAKYQYEISTELLRIALPHALDSVASDSLLHQLQMARELYQNIDNNRRALPQSMVEWTNRELKVPAFRQQVLALNEKYEAIARRDISNSHSLRSADDVAGMSDGEQILRKLIAPYEGKLVLIDVWGTWCGPCKQALADSQEEYERLAPYDMIFLYLANRSDRESWQNVIKENNVLGDNVVHYNLPAEQQRAVELFLKVNKYPSYYLIDRNGHLLEVNADPRDLNRFEELVRSIR